MNSKDSEDASTSCADVPYHDQQGLTFAQSRNCSAPSAMEDDISDENASASSTMTNTAGTSHDYSMIRDDEFRRQPRQEDENMEAGCFPCFRAGSSNEDQMETEDQSLGNGDEPVCSVSRHRGDQEDSETELNYSCEADAKSTLSGHTSVSGRAHTGGGNTGSGQSLLPSQSSSNGEDQNVNKDRPTKRFDWLYRDLSIEEEYNIATENGEEMHGGGHLSVNPMKRSPKVSKEENQVPKTLPPDSTERQEGVAVKPRSPHYTEFHLYQWFRNVHPHSLGTKHMSFFVAYKPGKIIISDLKLASLTEKDTTAMQSPTCRFSGKNKYQLYSKRGVQNNRPGHTSGLSDAAGPASSTSSKTTDPVPSTSSAVNDNVPSSSLMECDPVPSTSKAGHNYVSSTSDATNNVSSINSERNLVVQSTCNATTEIVSSTSGSQNGVDSPTSSVISSPISSTHMKLKDADSLTLSAASHASSTSTAIHEAENKRSNVGQQSGTASNRSCGENSEALQMSVQQTLESPCSSKEHTQNPQPSKWSFAAGDNQPSSSDTAPDNFANHPLQDHSLRSTSKTSLSTYSNSEEFPEPIASTSGLCPEGTKRSSGTSQECPPNKLRKLQEPGYDDGTESMETQGTVEIKGK